MFMDNARIILDLYLPSHAILRVPVCKNYVQSGSRDLSDTKSYNILPEYSSIANLPAVAFKRVSCI